MKFSVVLIIISVFYFSSVHASEQINIIPYPMSTEYGEGEMNLRQGVKIIACKPLESEALHLAQFLNKGFKKTSKIVEKGRGISLLMETELLSELGPEGYLLEVEKRGVKIKAATNAGIFYGIQSLKQLLPVSFIYGKKVTNVKIPILKIADRPRFSWRSFMLDVARNFKGVDEVKDLLDQMSLLKMNTFHWHLTDDQGWRIEIKKYPLLTEIGSRRRDTQTSRKSEERTGVPHEGFYTQEQIEEIIKYASARHITVVPEIEMPGHAIAAVAAYPWLGSLRTTKEVAVTFGKFNDSFNVSDARVVDFLKNVLTEVMSLFPGKVIHIGGDEVNFDAWAASEDTKEFMAEKQLKYPLDLQIYFTNEISEFIDSSGKRMMGWNEIMGERIHEEDNVQPQNSETKLAKSAIVHFWKGDLELINKAVDEGYDVVNSNHWDTYLDYTYKRLPLSKSYEFDPVPEGLDENYHDKILGFGTQMWSEWIPEVEQMQKQIFPRIAAYAEVGWTMTENKNFDRFSKSLNFMYERWNYENIVFFNP